MTMSQDLIGDNVSFVEALAAGDPQAIALAGISPRITRSQSGLPRPPCVITALFTPFHLHLHLHLKERP